MNENFTGNGTVMEYCAKILILQDDTIIPETANKAFTFCKFFRIWKDNSGKGPPPQHEEEKGPEQ